MNKTNDFIKLDEKCDHAMFRKKNDLLPRIKSILIQCVFEFSIPDLLEEEPKFNKND
jgi:hypothetical protein